MLNLQSFLIAVFSTAFVLGQITRAFQVALTTADNACFC